jgi:hypothetical protein
MGMMEARAVVLVVEPEASVRDHLAQLVEAEGYEVRCCPGPHAPDFDCIGVVRDGCPLSDGADIVLLDMELDSDLAIRGTSAIDLVGFYLAGGKGVLALSRGERNLIHPFVEEPLSLLRWPADEYRVAEVLTDIVERLSVGD